MRIPIFMKFSFVLILIMILSACSSYSNAVKNKVKEKMIEHLEERYNQKYEVTITGRLFYKTVGGNILPEVAGLKGTAQLPGESEIVNLEWWEKGDEILDDHISDIMNEKLSKYATETSKSVFGDDVKIEAYFDPGPFMLMPDSKWDENTKVFEYNETSALVTMYTKTSFPINKEAIAEKILKLQDKMNNDGMKRVSYYLFFLSDDEYNKLDATLEQVEKKQEEAEKSMDNYSIYDYCRSNSSCYTNSTDIDNGNYEKNKEELIASFEFRREEILEPGDKRTYKCLSLEKYSSSCVMEFINTHVTQDASIKVISRDNEETISINRYETSYRIDVGEEVEVTVLGSPIRAWISSDYISITK